MLCEYQNCFSDKPGKLPNEAHLEIDPSVSPAVHLPKKIPIALLEPAPKNYKEMDEDGIIVKQEEHSPLVSSILVIDKRKAKDKDTPDKDIDPRDLNEALKWTLSNGYRRGGDNITFQAQGPVHPLMPAVDAGN